MPRAQHEHRQELQRRRERRQAVDLHHIWVSVQRISNLDVLSLHDDNRRAGAPVSLGPHWLVAASCFPLLSPLLDNVLVTIDILVLYVILKQMYCSCIYP